MMREDFVYSYFFQLCIFRIFRFRVFKIQNLKKRIYSVHFKWVAFKLNIGKDESDIWKMDANVVLHATQKQRHTEQV